MVRNRGRKDNSVQRAYAAFIKKTMNDEFSFAFSWTASNILQYKIAVDVTVDATYCLARSLPAATQSNSVGLH